MGLDMYLNKKHYVENWEHNPPERQHKITIETGGKPNPIIDTSKINYIIEKAGYWRKANAIHKWFVDHVQEGVDECQESYVSRAQLQELYDTCVLVRDNTKLTDDGVIIDASVAQDLLPSASGFFFGSTDYDKYYMDDINDTIAILEAELKIEYPKGHLQPDYYYRASW